MVQRIREPLGNKIDQLVDWDRADGVKTFYAAAFFKTWAKNINLTV
jgi:hypothetical protein